MGDEKVRKENLHMMRWTKRERKTNTRSFCLNDQEWVDPHMATSGKTTSIPWSSNWETTAHLWRGQRDPGGDVSAKQERTRHISWGHTHQQCHAPGKSASRRLCALRSQQSLSGPGRQTLTWITETLTLTGNSSETLQNLDEGLNAFVKAILQDNLVLSAVVLGQ